MLIDTFLFTAFVVVGLILSTAGWVYGLSRGRATLSTVRRDLQAMASDLQRERDGRKHRVSELTWYAGQTLEDIRSLMRALDEESSRRSEALAEPLVRAEQIRTAVSGSIEALVASLVECEQRVGVLETAVSWDGNLGARLNALTTTGETINSLATQLESRVRDLETTVSSEGKVGATLSALAAMGRTIQLLATQLEPRVRDLERARDNSAIAWASAVDAVNRLLASYGDDLQRVAEMGRQQGRIEAGEQSIAAYCAAARAEGHAEGRREVEAKLTRKVLVTHEKRKAFPWNQRDHISYRNVIFFYNQQIGLTDPVTVALTEKVADMGMLVQLLKDMGIEIAAGVVLDAVR